MNGSSHKRVEIYAMVEVEDGTATTVIDSADYFSVFIVDHEKALWCADFAHYADAYNWADEVAENHKYELIEAEEGVH